MIGGQMELFEVLQHPLLEKVVMLIVIFSMSKKEIRKQFQVIASEMRTTNTTLTELTGNVKLIGDHMENLDKRVSVLETKASVPKIKT